MLFLQNHPLLFLMLTSIVGLCVGNAISTVIYRLPITLNADLANAIYPSTIPRHLFVQIFSMLLTVFCAYHFAFTWQFIGAIVFFSAMLTLIYIDIEHFFLPDDITLPMIWIGLFLNLFEIFTPLSSAVIGAISGYLIFWSVGRLFKKLRGIEGMGYGDYKLLALMGAWFGWQQLPLIIIISSFIGLIVGGTRLILGKQELQDPLPFGPFLATAGLVTLFWGDSLTHFYLSCYGGRLC